MGNTLRNLFAEIPQIRGLNLFLHFIHRFRSDWSNGRGLPEVFVGIHQCPQPGKGVVEETEIVPDVLDGCVDLMGDSRCQRTHRFEPLRLTEFNLQLLPPGHILNDHQDRFAPAKLEQVRPDLDIYDPAVRSAVPVRSE